jgi:hypothetical protein
VRPARGDMPRRIRSENEVSPFAVRTSATED